MEITIQIKNNSDKVIFEHTCENNTFSKTFQEAIQKNITFEDVTFQNEEFGKVRCFDANFINTKFVNCEFKNCKFINAHFKNVLIDSSIFNSTCIESSTFNDSVIQSTRFYYGDLNYTMFLNECSILKCSFDGVDFIQGRFSGLLKDVNFINGNLNWSRFVFKEESHRVIFHHVCLYNFLGKILKEIEKTNYEEIRKIIHITNSDITSITLVDYEDDELCVNELTNNTNGE